MTDTSELRGYRELQPHEIEQLNRVSELGDQLQKLLMDITVTTKPWDDGESPRWLSIGKTHLQQGLMAVKRAIAKPTTFS